MRIVCQAGGLRSSTGVVFLFIEEEDYARPVWPEEAGTRPGTRFACAGHNIPFVGEKNRVSR